MFTNGHMFYGAAVTYHLSDLYSGRNLGRIVKMLIQLPNFADLGFR